MDGHLDSAWKAASVNQAWMAEKNSAFRALHTTLHKMFTDANLKVYCMVGKHYGGLHRSKAIVVSKFDQALAKV